MAKSFISGSNKGSKKKGADSKLPTKKILLVAGVLALAFGLGAGAFYIQGADKERKQVEVEQREVAQQINKKPEGVVEQSEAKAFQGDYDGAQQLLGDELQKAQGDNQRQHGLLLQQAINAFNADRFADSLNYARQALEQSNTYQANNMAAQAAEADNQLEAAKQYYEAALDTYPKDSPLYKEDTDSIKEDIERVSR